MLPMTALTALVVRSEPLALPTSVVSCLRLGLSWLVFYPAMQGVSVKVDHLSDPS